MKARMASSSRILLTRIIPKYSSYFRATKQSFQKKIQPLGKLNNVASRKNVASKGACILTTLAVIPTVNALWGSSKADEKTPVSEEIAPELSKDQIAINRADELYSQNAFIELHEFLETVKYTDNADILWRHARAACDRAKLSVTNKEDRKRLMYEAFESIVKALETGQDNFAVHKWYAIMLDYVAEYEGTKQRLTNAFKVKEHFLKAVELNPKDATSIHLLGYWCFTFADLPWYQQKVAAVIFTTPPSSSYEEALSFFQKAEETDPNFYSMNLLYLGKTYQRLKDKDNAILWLKKTRDYPAVTEEDENARKEAIELLRGLGVKSPEQ